MVPGGTSGLSSSLFRYLDEQSFRYNEQKLTDRERFRIVLGVRRQADMGCLNLAGGRVTEKEDGSRPKVEEKRKPRMPPEYRRFRKLLQQVVKARPLRKGTMGK